MRFVSRSVITGLRECARDFDLHGAIAGTDRRAVAHLSDGGGRLGDHLPVPRVTKSVPSPLIYIIVLTAISLVFTMDIRTVGDMGELPSTLPMFLLPDIPLTLETLMIILPYSAAVAAVGLLESLMTQTIVDDLTDTNSDRNQECIGQGIANTTTGFIGGMAGCAMIGQSIINVKSGGRGRLSTLPGVLAVPIVVLGDWVKQIPMAALVAIMIMVSIGTFNSIKNLRDHPRSSSVVMRCRVRVRSHAQFGGRVLVGVLLSGIFFAWKIAQIFRVTSTLSTDGRERVYVVEVDVLRIGKPSPPHSATGRLWRKSPSM